MEVLTPIVRKDLEPAPSPGPNYPRNRYIMLRFLEQQDPQEIAEYYGLHLATILGILRSPLVQQEILAITGKHNEKIKERISRLGTEAVETVRDTMRGRNTNELRFKAAKELLDKHPEYEKKPSSAEDAVSGLGESIIRALSRRAAQTAENEVAANGPLSDLFNQGE